MGKEIFKQIRDAESKAAKMVEKAEKAKERVIKEAKEKASSIVEEGKLTLAQEGKKKIEAKSKEMARLKGENIKRIEAELAKIRLSASKNRENTIQMIITEIV